MSGIKYLSTLLFAGLALSVVSQRSSVLATGLETRSLGIAVGGNNSLVWIWTEEIVFLSRDAGESWTRLEVPGVVDSLKAAAPAINTPDGEQLSVRFADSSIRLLRKSAQSTDLRDVARYYTVPGSGHICARDGNPQLARSRGGRLYVAWSDNKGGPGNKDVYLTWSDNNGQQWPEPVVVTYRPNHKQQFMPALTLGPDSTVYLVYHDQQNSAKDDFSDIYLARSRNGGLLFERFRLNEEQIRCVDEPCAPAVCTGGNRLFVVWLEPQEKGSKLRMKRIESQQLDNWPESLRIGLPEKTIGWDKNTVFVPFHLPNAGRVTVILTNPVDARIKPMLLTDNKMYGSGSHRLRIKTRRKLAKGNYTITFYYDHKNDYLWIVDE